MRTFISLCTMKTMVIQVGEDMLYTYCNIPRIPGTDEELIQNARGLVPSLKFIRPEEQPSIVVGWSNFGFFGAPMYDGNLIQEEMKRLSDREETPVVGRMKDLLPTGEEYLILKMHQYTNDSLLKVAMDHDYFATTQYPLAAEVLG